MRGRRLASSEQGVHSLSSIPLQLAHDILIPAQDPRVGVAHRPHTTVSETPAARSSVAAPCRSPWSLIPANPCAFAQPFHILENVAGWNGSPIALHTTSSGRGSPNDSALSPCASRWRRSAAATNPGIGRSRRPATDFGGPKWSFPLAAVSVLRTCTVSSSTCSHARPRTSSRRSPIRARGGRPHPTGPRRTRPRGSSPRAWPLSR
jgi:hypothetical protein